MSISGILSSSISQKPFRGVNSPQTPRDDSHIELAVKLGSVTVRMKTIDEMLVHKELELARVEKELDALRIVAPLLRGENGELSEAVETTRTLTVMPRSDVPDEAVVDSPLGSPSWSERWREVLKRLLCYAGTVRLKVVRACALVR